MNQAVTMIRRFMQGRSEAFVSGFFLQLLLLFITNWFKPDTNWAGFAICLGAANAAFYGGGVWVNHSKRKFLNGGPRPNGSSSPSSG